MAISRQGKNTTKPVLRQVLDLIPSRILLESIQEHTSDKGCNKYKTYDQLASMIFGQLNKCYDYFDEQLYKERYVIERTNAWIDSFCSLLNRFDTKLSSWMAWNFMAFIVIGLKKFQKT